MTPQTLLALLAVALLAAGSATTYHALAGVRARRRAAWELERVEWREWMVRP